MRPYLPYLEEARVEYLRHLGHPYSEVREDGHNFAVLEVSVQYRRPLVFDEVVDVHLMPGAVSRATFQLAYLLTVAEEVRATAVTVHGCVDSAGKAVRLPAWIGEDRCELEPQSTRLPRNSHRFPAGSWQKSVGPAGPSNVLYS